MKVVILTILVLSGSKLHAQSDSLHIHLHGGSISVAGPTRILDRNYQYVQDGGGFSVDIPVNLDTMIPVHNHGTLYSDTPWASDPGLYVYFQLDSSQNVIRNLKFYVMPLFLGPYSESGYQLELDSLKLNPAGNVFSNSKLIDSFWAVWSGSYVGNGPQPGYYEVGAIQDSGWTPDTLSLALNIREGSRVSSKNDSFTTLFIEGRRATVSLESSNRNLNIYDLLGEVICEIPIPAGTNMAMIPEGLPPGIYFARIGSCVAKFVITN